MTVKTKRAVWLGSAVTIAFVGFATIASTALAESTAEQQVAQAQPTPTTPPAPPAEAKPEEKKVEKVVVTGSRLKKNEFTSSSPVQIITKEQSTLEGLVDTSDILQGSSVAAGSAQINNTLGGFVGFDGGPGANTVSLRGLGANRTLVLVNGRRLGPAGVRGQIGPVDLNTLPESMIDRIEILKDGGSSVYGSDAVAGVVNIITSQNTDGLVLTGNTNMSFDGGGETYQLGGHYAETFDRGSFLISGEYFRREALTIGERDYLSCPQDRVVNSLNGQILDIIDPATGQSKCFNSIVGVAARAIGGTYVPSPGLVAGGGFMPTQFRTPIAPPGPPVAIAGSFPNLANFQRLSHTYANANAYVNSICAVANGVLDGAAGVLAANPYCATPAGILAQKEALFRQSQGVAPRNDPRQQSTQIIAPVERYSFFAQGSYDLLPGVEVYTELFFNRRESEQKRWRQLFPTVDAANPSNVFATATQPISLAPSDNSQTVDFYRALFGARGSLGDKMPVIGNWDYDLYVQHTRSEGDYTGTFIYNDRVNATTGAAACNAAAITISNTPGLVCQPINWFGVNQLNGNWTDAEKAFLFSTETGHTTYTQSTVNGSISGDAFQVPYGAVSAALGFELRRDEIDDTPGFNARSGNFWGSSSAGRTAGSDSVAEAYAEVEIPLLNGMKFAEDLTLTASGRYTNYESYGDGSTYKLGLNYQITPEYRVRGTTGTSFRAPALYEIYLANQTGFLGQTSIDPCVGWETSADPQIVASCGPGGLNLPNPYAGNGSSALILTGGGGPGVLNAESSESRTVGFIWTPDWADFSIALDYWEIEVNGEVAQFGAANIITACHTNPPFGSSPFCNLFTRDTNPLSVDFGKILTVNDSFVNLNSQVTDGLDLTMTFEHEFSFGKFRFDGSATWTFTDEVQIFADGTTDDLNGELYEPDFVANLNFRFDYKDWTFNWASDILARSSNDEDFGTSLFNWRSVTPYNGIAYYKQYAEFYATHDASVRYRADDWSAVFGIQNIFNEEPPAFSTGGGFGRVGNSAAVTGQYDLIGRRAFLTITKEF